MLLLVSMHIDVRIGNVGVFGRGGLGNAVDSFQARWDRDHSRVGQDDTGPACVLD